MILDNAVVREVSTHVDDGVTGTTIDEPSSFASARMIPYGQCANIPLCTNIKCVEVYAESSATPLCI
jgi:hypothetical protein